MALFRECFWCNIKIVREKDKTEWMQKEDNIAGEMMQGRFCAVFSFCIIHVFIKILQNFSQEGRMPNHGHKNWNKYAFQPTIYPHFILNLRPTYTVFLFEAGHRDFLESKIAIKLYLVRKNLITFQHNGIPT